MKKIETFNMIKKEKKEEIIISKLLVFCGLMKEFNLNKNKIYNICTLIFDKYKSSKESRDQIFLYIKENI